MIIFAFLILLPFQWNLLAGVVEQTLRWKKSEIRVCWAVKNNAYKNCDGQYIRYEDENTALSKNEYLRYKQLIQETVSKDFQTQKVGVTFTGWTDCPGNDVGSQIDAVISLRTEKEQRSNFGGGATVGNCRERPVGGTSRIGFSLLKGEWTKKIKFDDFVKIVALHEFGHLAGLHHEDWIIERPEFIKEQGAKVLFGYNPVSVMSYTFSDDVSAHGLSFTLEELLAHGRVIPVEWKSELPSVKISAEGNVSVLPVLSAGDIRSLRCLFGIGSCQ